jgi:hypothetical protein
VPPWYFAPDVSEIRSYNARAGKALQGDVTMTKTAHSAIAITVAIVGAVTLGRSPGVAQTQPLAKPGFHHIHMNSPNPSAAVDEFMTVYKKTARVTIAGFEGLRTENGVHMLFTKVSKAPGVQGPDKPDTAPVTAFWHHVWQTPDGRGLLKTMRAADPAFDKSRKIPLYSGPDGATVDFSSDTYPGNLNDSQVAEAKAKGVQPTHRGGYFNWYGPDGVIMETTDAKGGPEAYRIIGMFEEQPYCALFWYRRVLNAGEQTSAGGRGARGGGDGESADAKAPKSEAGCKVVRGAEVTWPSTYRRGHARVPPPQLVVFGDVTMRWYINQENRPITSTRGQLMDHIALSVVNLDGWMAKFKAENVKILMPPYKFGTTRAAMIEGPSLEAIELVEGTANSDTQP